MKTCIIVCGSRDFTDYGVFRETLDSLIWDLTDLEIISGQKDNIAKLAGRYADERGIRHTDKWYYISDDRIKNALMLKYAAESDTAFVAAFCECHDQDIESMINLARSEGVSVYISKSGDKNEDDSNIGN